MQWAWAQETVGSPGIPSFAWPTGLRAAASETGTLIAVIDFLMFDDRLVMQFAESAGIEPATVAQIRFALAGPEVDPV